MAKHLVAVVGRRMEALVEVEAETEEQARALALDQADTLTERDWYVADEIETRSCERMLSAAEIAERGIRPW